MAEVVSKQEVQGHFTMIPNSLIRDSDLSANELLVYVALLSRCDQRGIAFPSVPTIARDSRTSVSVVKRTLKQLEGRGVVKREFRPRKNNDNETTIYHVATFEKQLPRPREAAPLGSERTQGGSTENPPLGPERTPKKTHLRTPIEEDIRSTQKRGHESFSFPDPNPKATEDQKLYLHDLFIHFNNEEATLGTADQWALLSKKEASVLIDKYLALMPRYDAYEGPELGEQAYDALSGTGQQWADMFMLPE